MTKFAVALFVMIVACSAQAGKLNCCPSGTSGAGNCQGCSGGENSCVAKGSSVCCYGGSYCKTKRNGAQSSFCWNGSSAVCVK